MRTGAESPDSVSDSGLPGVGREPLLEVEDLSVEFRGPDSVVRVLDHVSFTVGRGERVAMVGESGSGKSVTALAVLGLLPDSAQVSGSIRFEGKELVGLRDRELADLRGEQIALVFQDPLSSLNPVYTVGHQIAELYRRRRGANRSDARKRAIEAMDRVRIPHPGARFDQYPHQFSGGMRQRAMIAMALALEPRMLIADEPTTALDVTVETEITALLRRLSDEEDMALLFISHDLGVVADVSEKITVLYGGQVFEQGRVQEVYEASRNPYTVGLLRSIPEGIGSSSRELVGIPGRPPNPSDWPRGCRFQPRCWRAESTCADGPVPLRSFDHRASRCHFADSLAGGTA